MTSPNTDNPSMPGTARDDLADTRIADTGTAAGREAGSASDEARKAGRTIRDDASGLAETAKHRATEEMHRQKEAVAGGMDDFAAAVRKASDELGERDRSMAANMVREVASGLEQASRSVHGQSLQDLTRSVATFARRQPTTFLVGAALAGLALGRFVRASGEHAGGHAGGHSGAHAGAGRTDHGRHGYDSGEYDSGFAARPASHEVADQIAEPRSTPTSGGTDGY